MAKRLNYILLIFLVFANCKLVYSQVSPIDLLKKNAESTEKKKDEFMASSQKITEQQANDLIPVCDSILNHPSSDLKPFVHQIEFLKGACLRKLKRFGEAIELFKSIEPDKDVAFENTINEMIGKSYLMMSSYNLAVGYLFKVLNYWTVVKPDVEKQVNTLTSITTCYYRSKLFDKAFEYTQKGIAIAETTKDPKLLYLAYSNLGIYFLEKHDIKKADSIYTKLLPYIPSLSAMGKVAFYNNYSETKRLLKDYDKAKTYIDSCYRLAVAEKDTFWTAIALVNKANLNIVNNHGSEAVKECSLALKYATRFKSLVWQRNSCTCLYEAYEKLNDHKNALLYFKKTKGLSDSILNEKNRNEATQKDFQYKYAVKAAADSVKQVEANKVKDAQILAQQSQLNQEKIVRISLFILAALILIFTGFIYNRFKISQKQKKIIEDQKVITESQKELLEEKQKEIIDSINYAKRIQYTLLTNSEFLNKHLPEHFIYFEPKDIVSGDFYWSVERNGKLYLAVCDSTGHGVPGAFMSLLSIGFLNEAVTQQHIEEPHKIFDFVREKLIENISREGQQDGFDGILLCMDKERKTITYAAANNSPVLVRGGEMIPMQSNRMPVGMGEKKDAFDLFTLNIQKDDSLYLYTDGYADQFGGEKGKKYKYKALNEFLIRNHSNAFRKQREFLGEEFKKWKGPLEQVDDVCILGMKL